MLGEEELDRGREERSRPATTPCPPLPFVAAGESKGEVSTADRTRSPRTALAIGVGAIAIVALGGLLVGGRGAEAGQAPADTLPGSAEVARVTAPNAPADRVHPGAGSRDDTSGQDGAEGSGKGGKHHPASDNPSGGDDGGTGGGGGGGGDQDSKPLATVNLPVVGMVTVDEPDLPPPPDADAPDLPDAPLPDLSDVKLP